MHILTRRTIAACVALGLAAAGSATVTLTTSFVGTPVFATSSTVTVRTSVTNNNSGLIPASAAIRIGYDAALFRFISATGNSANGFVGAIDSFAVGPEEVVSGTFVTRDIPTVGNFTNTSPTPTIMDVDFEVLTTSPSPTSITIDLDPGVSAGLNSLYATVGQPIPNRVMDFSATQNFVVPVGLSAYSLE